MARKKKPAPRSEDLLTRLRERDKMLAQRREAEEARRQAGASSRPVLTPQQEMAREQAEREAARLRASRAETQQLIDAAVNRPWDLERVKSEIRERRSAGVIAAQQASKTAKGEMFPLTERTAAADVQSMMTAERSGVEYTRTGRMARSASFPMREESARAKRAESAIRKRGEEVTPEAVEAELQRGDVPSRYAAERVAPFFKDSQVRPERAEVVSRQQVEVYTCDCGKTIERGKTPVCLCKVSAGKVFETREAMRKRARRQKNRAAANQAVVTAQNATEAALKASLAVEREAVRGRGARPALLTEEREMSRIAQRSGYEILREQFEKTALKADILERKLREDEEAGKLPIGVRDNLRRSIAKLRKKANELRDMAESQKRYGTEAQAFKLSGIESYLGIGSLVVAGLGLFLVYRTFQAPTA